MEMQLCKELFKQLNTVVGAFALHDAEFGYFAYLYCTITGLSSHFPYF